MLSLYATKNLTLKTLNDLPAFLYSEVIKNTTIITTTSF